MKRRVENEAGVRAGTKRLKRAIYILLSIFALTGCGSAGKISVTEARMPTLHELNALNGRAAVENGGTRDLMIESARIAVRYRGRELGTARLLLPVLLPAGARSEVRYDFALEGFSLASMQTIATRFATGPDAFTVDVSARVRLGAMRKKIELREVPVTRIFTIFGAL